MKYLSLFSGVGGIEYAIHNTIERAECVGFSEIDKHAIKVFEHRFPMNVGKNIGCVKKFISPKEAAKLPDFDLLVGGSPCNDLSIAKGNRKGLDGSKSSLFWAYVEILKAKKPKYFLLENVASMPAAARDQISEVLGVPVHEINSDRFTPQKRKRYYWYNWNCSEALPEQGERWSELVAWSRSTRYKDEQTGKIHSGPGPGRISYVEERETRDGRANTLTTGFGCGSFSSKNFREVDGELIPLHPDDCEDMQGFPVGWTEIVSDTQRYRQIGNAVTIPTIEYILRGLK